MKRTISTDNQAEIAARFAGRGHNDPTIARVLGVSVSTVRRLREEYGIAPGETRWLPHTSPHNLRYAEPERQA
ncbi:helix-turn-helix domain-containing protein [Nonomuraea sp. B19D2]|uniref:helix-turn-helix domain-containing protein n=1 Tax=Nonomuraea sp. B19D2 TaxID=3159561 RepID=UPI0032DA02B5